MFSQNSAVLAAGLRTGKAHLLVVIAVAAMVTGSCSGGDTEPTPPPTTNNTPPVVQSVTAGSTRVEAGEEIQLTAVVTDAETPVAQLTYAWSASPSEGVIVGSGASVRWRAPKPASTPNTYTLTLTVTETYGTGSNQRTNTATGSVQVRYNDSSAEIQSLVTKFLTDFSTDSVSADAAVVNFSDSTTLRTFSNGGPARSCAAEKAQERQDVQNVRNLFHSIPPPTLSFQAVSFNLDRTFADPVLFGCTFRNTPIGGGAQGGSIGTCDLSAVYEDFRWMLCRSNFNGVPLGSSVLSPVWFRYSHP